MRVADSHDVRASQSGDEERSAVRTARWSQVCRHAVEHAGALVGDPAHVGVTCEPVCERLAVVAGDVVENGGMEHDRGRSGRCDRNRVIDGVDQIAVQHRWRILPNKRDRSAEPFEARVMFGPDQGFEPRPARFVGGVDRVEIDTDAGDDVW